MTQELRTKELKLLLRAQEIARGLLASSHSEAEVQELLRGFTLAIELGCARLVRCKGRGLYLFEMLGTLGGRPAVSGTRVLFSWGVVDVEPGNGVALEKEILALEECYQAAALCVMCGERKLLL